MMSCSLLASKQGIICIYRLLDDIYTYKYIYIYIHIKKKYI